jgi:hypothetical protein
VEDAQSGVVTAGVKRKERPVPVQVARKPAAALFEKFIVLG